MYTGKIRIPTNRFCFKCNSRVYHSDVKGYPYVCHRCDENMFTFETYKKKDKNTYFNPITKQTVRIKLSRKMEGETLK